MPLHFADPSLLIDMIIRYSPIGIAVLDFDGNYLVVNPAYCHLYGYSESDLLGHSFTMIVAEQDHAAMLARHKTFLTSNVALRGEWDVIRCDGSKLTVFSESIRLLDDAGAPLHLVYVVDITERKCTERKLQSSESLFRAITTIAPVGIFRADALGKCIYINERWCEIAGLSYEQALGDGWVQAIHPEDREHVASSWYKATHADRAFNDEYRFARKDGKATWVLCRAIAEKNSKGETISYVGTITDISERKAFELELVNLATTDFLTGLANRRSFITSIDKELARMRRSQEHSMTFFVRRTHEKPVGLLMIDLDHFKNINDNYGHAVGDSLLQHFSAIVKQELREIDMAGRLGGEEFCIMLPGANLADSKVFAERLCEHIATSPLMCNGEKIKFTVSIGVSVLRYDDLKSDTVLARADKALYQAKMLGRNRVETFMQPVET